MTLLEALADGGGAAGRREQRIAVYVIKLDRGNIVEPVPAIGEADRVPNDLRPLCEKASAEEDERFVDGAETVSGRGAPHAVIAATLAGQEHVIRGCSGLGRRDLAFDALQKAGQFSSGNSKAIALRGYLLAKVGRPAEAREVLNTLEAVSRERYVPPYSTALVYCGLGQHDQALDWLDRAYDAHDVHLALTLVDPKWDDFRSDDRFLALIKRCAFIAGNPLGTA